ncbi:MAG TPA: cytochrome d ubiquinol oxidase subunit II [Ktedonobacterales bacterium]|jgi:cytochrome d ubiquinol oxidase subunit II|nr:cytochrome d ubiquinol oxidase subunit II [Ktedonobacterales bacterium]
MTPAATATPSLPASICAGLVGAGLIAYAVLGGADFGAGVWDLLARGPRAARQREAISHALGPVWEANNVWLIYVIVITWTAFPLVYASVSTALFIPIVLALVGIVLRGAGFGLRSQYARRAGIATAWGYAFNGASVIAPFMLGALAGGIAGGDILVRGGVVQANYWTTWTTPFALACGAFAVGLCATLAATYLAVEAEAADDAELSDDFRVRALIAGAITAALGALAALLAAIESPTLWAGLIGKALPLSLGAMLIGLLTAVALFRGRYVWARYLVAGEMACILAAWAVAQYPYLIIPDVTIANAAAPSSVLLAAIIASAAGMVVLLPSLWYLFHIFKGRPHATERVTAASLADQGLRIAFAPASGDDEAEKAAGRRPHSAPQP